MVYSINLPINLASGYTPRVAGTGIYISTTNPSFDCTFWRQVNSLSQGNSASFSCVVLGESTNTTITPKDKDDGSGGTSLTKDVSGVLISVGLLNVRRLLCRTL